MGGSWKGGGWGGTLRQKAATLPSVASEPSLGLVSSGQGPLAKRPWKTQGEGLNILNDLSLYLGK